MRRSVTAPSKRIRAGTGAHSMGFSRAMFDCSETTTASDAEIARHEVSEDGVTWRPYDPARDTSELLHTRIVFADPQES